MGNLFIAAIEKYLLAHPEVIERLVEQLIAALIARLAPPTA